MFSLLLLLILLTPSFEFSAFDFLIAVAVVLLAVGLVSTATFFVYQMRGGKPNIFIELGIGSISSVLLGLGSLFMMMSFGLYP